MFHILSKFHLLIGIVNEYDLLFLDEIDLNLLIAREDLNVHHWIFLEQWLDGEYKYFRISPKKLFIIQSIDLVVQVLVLVQLLNKSYYWQGEKILLLLHRS